MENQRKYKKRGVSSVVGAIFVLAIIVIGATSVVYISLLENNVHQAENSVALIDTAKNQERLNIQNIQFGGSQNYNPTQAYVSGAGCSGVCGITMTVGNSLRWDNQIGNANNTLYPAYLPFNVTSSTTTGYQEAISNMNFSTTTDGWTVYTTSSQVIGGFAATQGNGVPGSGVGAMYLGASFISRETVSGNESTQLYVDPTSSGVGGISTATFSYAHYISQNAIAGAKIASISFSIYLIDKTTGQLDSGTSYLITTVSYPNANSGDTAWVYLTDITNLANGTAIWKCLANDKGFYQIVIVTTITFQNGSCNSACTQFFGYYDDVGLRFGYNSFVTDWDYTFHVGQSPTSVKQLSFGVTSFYNQTNVVQYVYLYDWILNSWDSFSSSTVSTQPSTVSLAVNVSNTGQYSAQNLVSSNGLVRLRMYSVRAASLLTGALGNHMETDVSAIDGISVTITFTSQNAFTVILSNGGPQPLEIVSLVIIDSNGHTYINATGAKMYNDSFNSTLTFDQVIYPLQTISIQVPYKWTSGSITFTFLTARGNVYIVSATAS